MKQIITTSIFELFKVGPGPSSSHTIGPMLATLDFRSELEKLDHTILSSAKNIRVRLLGSLSATGFGHGTHKAVVTGLLGYEPSHCPPDLPAKVFSRSDEDRRIVIGPFDFIVDEKIVIDDVIDHPYPYSNTMVCELLSDKDVLFEKIYYSVGGGFVQWEGWHATEQKDLPYPYTSAADLQRIVAESGLSIPQIILANEMALTGKPAHAILEELDQLIDVMRRSVTRGVNVEGMLPGTLGVYRKAAQLAESAKTCDTQIDHFLCLLNAYAFAVAEENAAGGIIVTAPTCGAAGVIPSILVMIEEFFDLSAEAVREGLMAAAAIGFIAKHNAGIAGAEVGCQGEIGVASAMAAAMLAQAKGYSSQIVENAAEIALEHHLGLTCDPVGGYVQIPCIERNAMGALKAYNAFLVATHEDIELHRVTLDATIKAMAETGRDMNAKYKETSLGGLAVSIVEC